MTQSISSFVAAIQSAFDHHNREDTQWQWNPSDILLQLMTFLVNASSDILEDMHALVEMST